MAAISVIVPFFKAADHIFNCASALTRQDIPDDDYEILMIDNNSTDESKDVLQPFQRITILNEEEQGAYAARNRGIAAARGSVLAFTDPDCVPADDWLRRIVARFKDCDTAILIGSHFSPKASWAVQLFASHRNATNDVIFGSNDASLYYGMCNNMAVRKDVFATIGPFARSMRGSDTQLVRQYARQFGCDRIAYDPDVTVDHLETNSVCGIAKKLFVHGANTARVNASIDSKGRGLTGSEKLDTLQRVLTKFRFNPLKVVGLLVLLSLGKIMWSIGGISVRTSGSTPR